MGESTQQKPIRDYKDLHVWQKGMELAKQVYLLTSRFPSEEKFGLISQMRRAAFSIPCAGEHRAVEGPSEPNWGNQVSRPADPRRRMSAADARRPGGLLLPCPTRDEGRSPSGVEVRVTSGSAGILPAPVAAVPPALSEKVDSLEALRYE